MTNNRRLYNSVSKIVMILILGMIACVSGAAQVWTVVSAKSKGTARDPALPAAAQLSYRYDKLQDFLWFRVSLYGAPNENAFGVNIVLDTGADEATKMNWWGANTAFKFDKLITAWVTRGDKGYQGTIGVGNAAGVKAKQINNLLQNNLQVRVEGDSILLGVKRTDVTDKLKMNLIAAVGSNQQWNDDLPRTGFATIDLAAERPKVGLREIDLSRNNLEFSTDYRTLPHAQAPYIIKEGHGPQTLILVPGMYSGKTSFDSFIAGNQLRYTFYVLTPPGINGTTPRAMPAKGLRLGERIWTRLLERDILNLISREKITRPIIIAGSHPASTAAIDLAVENPDKIGGVVIAGTNLVQFFPSPTDPTRKSPGTLEQRVDSVEEGWAPKWFKYVTPETWNSNDMRPEMLSGDLPRGQKASQEIEEAPLPVKIRYLCEFWASDVTRDIDRLQVPMLALIPGFDEKYLSDPANAFTKMAYVDSWETLIPKSPKVELVKIPGARLLVLEDQPKLADDAIATFIEHIGKLQNKRESYFREGSTASATKTKTEGTRSTRLIGRPKLAARRGR